MEAPRGEEVLFFFANVGRQPKQGDPHFVEKAKQVMELMTEEKIFLKPQDEVGIILASGTKHRDGRGGFTVLHENKVPTWEMVEDILAIKKTNGLFQDQYAAFMRVLKYLKNNVSGSHLHLILLFDCSSTCPRIYESDIKIALASLKKLNIQLTWIGSKQLIDVPSERLNNGEKMFMDIIQRHENGSYKSIDATLPSLRIFKKRKSCFLAWKCDLEIGDIKIPTVTYVQAVEDVGVPSFKYANTKIEDGIEMVTGSTKPTFEHDYVDRRRRMHPMSDTISCYMYGQKFFPVPDGDDSLINVDRGPKSFKVYGFVSRTSVKLEDLSGNSSRIVLPDGPMAVKPFYCLAEAMVEYDCVAIVRRIYRKTSEPKMGVLIPHIKYMKEPACFISIDLLFDEDRRVPQSGPLTSIIDELTDKQKDLVTNLVDSMMLTGTDDNGDEPFAPGSVPSPGLQHLWNSLSHRALNPDAPVQPMDENLKKLLESPELIKIKSEPLLKKVKEVFGIKDRQGLPKIHQFTNFTGIKSSRLSNLADDEVEIIEVIDKHVEKLVVRPKEPIAEELIIDLDLTTDSETE